MMLWSTTLRKQQGNALILVVFIIVVVGFVALVANRNQARSSQQLVSMVLGTRAEMAARSALNIELSRFYQTTTGSCHTSTLQNIDFVGEGLGQCVASVTCQSLGALDNGQEVYQLSAIGRCQVGDWSLQRIIEVGVKSE
ncbi:MULTISPECIES: MSHA biogenesis protein MshP [Vibrio]|uniref:MSHA biogenesis protein MshP n=1 Tax=Vibrio TaxID=662 RepID=UPI001652130B|nr:MULTISPECIES: MSHA biogenesis protein MshP [Vibrio]MCO7012924.1 MSHA biogenesis protein MshP [Vibrio paracholerae]MCO7033187.1 MSHA biogenesis protein MshP [Vibrio paracholerae]MCO7046653.1 MSHA biogenesis protein MshP [Vibrio paracholerae]MCX9579587.1 MSHA biogenesis protein MshP [Vibrio cholerae]MCX9583709.1 MSHA biogenesis protein MshP [Vibrio cholerae]